MTLRGATRWPVLLAVAVACAASVIWIDRPLALRCATLPARAVQALEIITELGKSTWYLAGAAAAYLFFRLVRPRPRPRAVAAFVFWSVAGSGLLLNGIKALLGRARPVQLLDHGDFGWHFLESAYSKTSFPSGHSNTITALVLALLLVVPPSRRLWALGTVMVVLVAASRVLLTHHYPSDVIAGAYLAVVTTLWLKEFMERRGHELAPPANPHS